MIMMMMIMMMKMMMIIIIIISLKFTAENSEGISGYRNVELVGMKLDGFCLEQFRF
jgi:hypothetical protein